MRLIDADALLAECKLAQKKAEKEGKEYANAFCAPDGTISTEWWCVEDLIENAPTVEPETVLHITGTRKHVADFSELDEGE